MDNQLSTTNKDQPKWVQNIIYELNNPPDSIWDTKYYVVLFKGLDIELIEAVFNKVAFEIRLELEKVESNQKLNDFDDDWAIQQIKDYFYKSNENEYFTMMSYFYEKSILEVIKDIKSVFKIHALMLDDEDEDIINELPIIFSLIESKPTSYFRLMVLFVKVRNITYRLEKLYKRFIPFKIPNKSNPIRKAQAVFVQILEDFIKRKILNEWLEKIKILEQVKKRVYEDTSVPIGLAARVISLRYIFKYLGIIYIGNEDKVLKLIYFLLHDYKQVDNIAYTAIQNIYELQNLPCTNCPSVEYRNKAVQMFNYLGNQTLLNQVVEDNYCCKDNKALEKKLDFDISYICKKNKQRHYAIIFDLIFTELGLKSSVGRTNKTEFIIWITGVTNNSSRIQDTTMYDYLNNPLGNYNQESVNALKEVQNYLSGMGLKNIEEKIKKDFKTIKDQNPNVKT